MRVAARYTITIVVLTAVLGCGAHANPIPDSVILRMNELAREFADGVEPDERTELVETMGRYSFRFWDAEVLELIESRIEDYCPVVVECQGPGHSIDFGLHRWFRSVAPDTCERSMCRSLRLWLTEEISEAPPSGSMQTTGPASAVSSEIMWGRVKAAEVLADYGDTTAAALIEALIQSPESGVGWSLEEKRGSFRWLLNNALARLRDPTTAALLLSEGSGSVRLPRGADGIRSATVGQPFNHKYPPSPFDGSEARRLFALLGESTVSTERNRGHSGLALSVEFDDGARAHIYLGHRPFELVYEDNMRVEHPSILLQNESLYGELEALREREYTSQWRGPALLDAAHGVLAGMEEDEAVFVELVGRDNSRFFGDEAFALLEENFDRFAPLIVEAQRPSKAIDYRMQDWYWHKADAAQREAMLIALRSWLTGPLPEEESSRLGRTARTGSAWEDALARVEVAEFLVDYGDLASVPLVESLRDSLLEAHGGLDAMPGNWVEIWWYLHLASIRSTEPERAAVCVPSVDHELDMLASRDDVAAARFVNFSKLLHPNMPVGETVAARVLELLDGAPVTGTCRDYGRFPCHPGNSGIMIMMFDGRELTVSCDASDVLYCSDNTRWRRWAYELTEPGLVGLLREIEDVFEAELPMYPAVD